MDIGFEVNIQSGESSSPLLPNKRCALDEALVQGEVDAMAPGTYSFRWDNTYSWVSSKPLRFRVSKAFERGAVAEPEPEA